ncbi:hypothetical protein TNCV_90791 [Trichonephila clavipes]|nr:hypothetical protein TNCV_90791 [Trichonephila clavipes]
MPKIVVRECETLKNKISIRRPAKTSTERSREFRERKKALKNAASQELNISSSIITETTPKTPAERSRDYRARKRQKSEENQESNDLTRITVEVEVHQEQDNSQPSTSTLPIKRKKTSTERVREFRARKKSLTSLSENIIEDFPTSSNIINANNNNNNNNNNKKHACVQSTHVRSETSLAN